MIFLCVTDISQSLRDIQHVLDDLFDFDFSCVGFKHAGALAAKIRGRHIERKMML